MIIHAVGLGIVLKEVLPSDNFLQNEAGNSKLDVI
jgi:hypothetical protein